uniref:Uncharacterized protein n=1 Tax=Meloidogyne enterolobii TaxID=390850 RepID=A0A6V7WXP8_MELEN|nr:unnamed protein product [Meloidogyne enterolobii]
MISMFSYTNLSNNNLGKEDSKRIIRNKIGQAVSLKNMLDAVEKLGFIMSQSSLSFFVENKMKLTDCRLSKIGEIVNKVISTEVNSRKRKGYAPIARDYALFAVAEKQNVLLDMARRVYQELVERVMGLFVFYIVFKYSVKICLNIRVGLGGEGNSSVRIPPPFF